jgi:predicted aspartyl protease
LEAALGKIVGSVDDLGRPTVRIDVPGCDGFLAVVDTGFNRSLLLTAAEAIAMKFVIEVRTDTVELATTAQVLVRRATGTIRWLGRDTAVDALIADEPATVHRPDTARALIGAELLAKCLVLVDYPARRVEIETQS